MKKIILIIAIGLFCFNLNAQHSGIIVYAKKANFEGQELSFEQRRMAETLKKNLKKLDYKLEFNENEAIFQLLEKLNIDGDYGLQMASTMGNGNAIHYTNFVENNKLQEKEISGKKFIIEEDLDAFEWDTKKESKTILGHKTIKAVTWAVQPGSSSNKKIKIEAWFAPNIPVHAAPLGYANLPGLVLELRVNERFTYTAKDIVFQDNVEITPPKKGERLSLKEYNKHGRAIAREIKERHKK